MYTKVLVFVAFVAAVAAYPGHHEHVIDYHAPANYEFKYGVSDHHTGDEKEQFETRHGDVVKGQYSLKEADGTIRTVKYTADDKNGFNAVVERHGHAIHPEIVHKTIVHAAPIIAHAAPISIGHGGLGGHGLGGNGGGHGGEHGGEIIFLSGGHGLGGGHGGHGGEAISFAGGHLGYGGHH